MKSVVRMRRRHALFLVLLLLLVPLMCVYINGFREPVSISAHSASFAGSGSDPLLYVNPSEVPLGNVGSTFTVQVKVANMDQFNGWDIGVFVDNPVINATSLSIAGNDFAVNASSGTAFEIVHCVNGAGSGCTSSDRQGMVHSAYGNTAVLTGNGLLFTITYKVTGNYNASPFFATSPLAILNDGISSPSSGSGVPHTTQSGNYGNIPVITFGGAGTRPRQK